MKRQELVIKVCGMRQGANIQAIEALDVDWIGFIFWPKSSRCVTVYPDFLPKHSKRVGVFVDETPETILHLCQQYALDYLQLHGHESLSYINQLHRMIVNQGEHILPPQLIKAFSIATAGDLEQTKDFEGLVDYFLFDAKGASAGGNGVKYDWDMLSDYHGQTPFLLSGGIGPEDAHRILAFHHPQCIGIDLNSRFEQSPGLKDIIKINTFLKQLKQ